MLKSIFLFTTEYLNASPGVSKKIQWQAAALHEIDSISTVYLGFFSMDNNDIYQIYRSEPHQELYEEWKPRSHHFHYKAKEDVYTRLATFSIQNHIDLIYIRYPQATHAFVRLLHILKKSGIFHKVLKTEIGKQLLV